MIKNNKSVKNGHKKDGNGEKHYDVLMRICENLEFFMDEMNEAYAVGVFDGKVKTFRITGKELKSTLFMKFQNEMGSAPSTEAYNQAINMLEAKYRYLGVVKKRRVRVAKLGKSFFYDLADKEGSVVEITPQGCKILRNSPVFFYRGRNMQAQVIPDFKGDISLIDKYVRFKNLLDKILYRIYLVTCLVPTICHPILVVHGEKGAAKSTTLEMTKSIVDPALNSLRVMPNSIQDLAITLSNSYMTCFDNMEVLSPDKSNLLCVTSTGGAFSTRELYTNTGGSVISLENCVGLDGINLVVVKDDIIDRSLIFELKRVPEDEAKSASELWKDFEADKASILGGALEALRKAMKIVPTVKLNKTPRMTDFAVWGYAIAEALGYGGDVFLKAYQQNHSKANEEAIASHPVASAVEALMKNSSPWNGTVAELLGTLERVAEREKIDTHVKVWPNAAHILSRRLKEVESNLKQVGITFDIRHHGAAKVIKICKSVSQQEEAENAQEKPRPKPKKIVPRPVDDITE